MIVKEPEIAFVEREINVRKNVEAGRDIDSIFSCYVECNAKKKKMSVHRTRVGRNFTRIYNSQVSFCFEQIAFSTSFNRFTYHLSSIESGRLIHFSFILPLYVFLAVIVVRLVEHKI